MSNFRITFSNPWLLLLLVPLAALTLIPHFRVAKKFRRSRNRVISLALHSIALILCVLLLAGMTFRYEVPNRENQLILLVDVSDSGAEVEEARNEFIQTVLNACDESCEVGIVTFGYGTVYAAPLSADAREVYRQYLEADKPDTGATDIATALEFAAAQITKPATARILLLSDGVETDGRALATVKTLTSGGIGVDAVDMTAPHARRNSDSRRGDAGGQGSCRQGSHAEGDGAEQLSVCQESIPGGRGQGALRGTRLTLKSSRASRHWKCRSPFRRRDCMTCASPLTAGDDNLSQNNSFQSFLNIPVFENVLVLENQPGESADLAALLGEDFRVTVLNIHTDADRLPTSAKELCAYEQVVLVNIANSDLTGKDAPNGFDQALYDYVYRMGGSLLTVGGQNDVGADGKPTPHAYNRSDLSGTLFQQMLPVQAIDYTPPIAVMLVIDCSGSMSSGRFEAALRGAEECLDSLTERDYCGVMGFSTSSTEHVSVMPVSQKETIRTAIRNLNDEGGGSGGTIFLGRHRPGGTRAGSRFGGAAAHYPGDRR
ncbi:MAG: VWA domain-containing protein [Oscillospiraceae bacterium]|nr:MAG: VWA domain-containing protein [Oscillospiraceae bacterium]